MARSGHDAYVVNALRKYTYSDIAKRDVLSVFQQYSGLHPKMEAYIFKDGMQKDLLSLEGTIPVSYKGITYNIPVQIWILDTHPYNPPMVFVKPTSTMDIRQGRNVDENGKVDLPYLRDWRYPQSDLLGLMQIMTIVFGEEPPVFKKVPSRPPYPGQAAQGSPYPAQDGDTDVDDEEIELQRQLQDLEKKKEELSVKKQAELRDKRKEELRERIRKTKEDVKAIETDESRICMDESQKKVFVD